MWQPRPIESAARRIQPVPRRQFARGLAMLATLLGAGGLAPASASAAAPGPAARSAAVWQDLAGRPPATRNGAAPEIAPRRFRALTLDRDPLADVLAAAPRARTAAARTAPLTISLPAPGGGMERFAIEESPIMEAALAATHPEIATYRGTSLDVPGATVALDLTPQGLHASVRGPGGSWYVDPYYHRDQSVYVSYRGRDVDEDPHGGFVERSPVEARASVPGRAETAAAPGDLVPIRNYRLALASDPTYATYHGAANVTAAKVTLVNRVNQIYEDDLAIKLILVDGNDVLNFNTTAQMTGPGGPCGASACFLASEIDDCDVDTIDRNDEVLNQLIGVGNYDIGHIGMGTSGGIAYVGVVGGALKGGGCTGVTQPVGDLFAVDYVAHEMGHQFDADHTFNGVNGSCAANIGGATTVEPGSGSTIMAYAGICGADNLQPHSDPYFSQLSIGQINAYVAGAPSRGGTPVATANHSPVVTAPAGFTIPTRTPFHLTGAGSDADADALTYLWEQDDAGSGTSLFSNTKSGGPLFRVFGTAANVSNANAILSPSPGQNVAGTDPTRVFPDLAQILANTTNAATGQCPAANVTCFSEFLPTSGYADALHFRLTARDGAGGVSHADTTLTLAKSAGPFRITSQPAASVDAGTRIPLTWSVAATNVAPVSAANVRVTLSTDGGLTFPKVVLRSTPNDGSQTVLLPEAAGSTARLRIEPIGNVFFDIGDANFTIVPGAPVVSSDAPGATASVQYSDPLAPTITATANDINTAGTSLTATISGLPGLTVTPAAPGANSRAFTVGGTANAPPGTYPVEVTVNDNAATNHEGVAAFDVVVSPEDASATYTGDTVVTGAPGATVAPVTLSAAVSDSADGAAGDLGTATATFMEGSTTLCSIAVSPAGTADCGAISLATGAVHRIDVVIGGRYVGAGSGDVDVRRTAAITPPPPLAPPPPPPPVTPPPVTPPPVTPPPPSAAALRVLSPNLASVAGRLKVSKTGRVAVRLRCRATGTTGTLASTCRGTVRLTARIGGTRRTIGAADYGFPRTGAKTVSVKLTAAARRAIRKATAATLTVSTTNSGQAGRTATKAVTVVPRTT